MESRNCEKGYEVREILGRVSGTKRRVDSLSDPFWPARRTVSVPSATRRGEKKLTEIPRMRNRTWRCEKQSF